MFCRTAALTLTLLFVGVLAVSAQETTQSTQSGQSNESAQSNQSNQSQQTSTMTPSVPHTVMVEAPPTVTLLSMSRAPRKRPVMLPVLYGSYALLQTMDIVSTKRAIAAGAHEANPLATSGNLGATIAIKAATGAATFFAAEKLWKKNRVGAVLLMVAANGISAAVVSHNLGNAR